MKNIYLFVLAIFGLLLVSCKDKDKDPAPTVGSLRATVSPAGSVSAMRATAGGTIYEASPDANNTFVIGNLPPGQYTVTFRTNPNFREPANRTAEVIVGKETDLGTITAEKVVDTGTFSATLNGNNWISPLPFGTMNSGNLIITGTQVSLSGSSEVIALLIPNFTGPGIYNSPANATATVSLISLTGPAQNWATVMGQCQVNITKFEADDKLVSGTFSFLATPAGSGASGSKTATNGTFTDVSFQ